MMDKIPYYVRYNSTTSISNGDYLFYDNGTNITIGTSTGTVYINSNIKYCI